MENHISEGDRKGFACRRVDDCWFPECSCPPKPPIAAALKAAQPQSLTQERYVAAWHVKQSLR